MSEWWRDSKPRRKRPPPARGIKVKKIGATWWGKRWIEALEKLSVGYSNRLSRGRTYARAGRVHDLEVAPGEVTASVTGSRPRPYEVSLRLPVLSREAWERVTAEMARQAVFAAELLAGHMPQDIDQAFRAAGQSLFPMKATELKTDCSCPDWANPCKHVAATHYVLGEAFDKDPFLIFELRGQSKNAVLGALRKLRTGGASKAKPTGEGMPPAPVSTFAVSAKDLQRYERLGAPVGHLHFRVDPPATPAALVRQLGALPSWSLPEAPTELLSPLYEAASALARELALGPVESSAPPRPKRR